MAKRKSKLEEWEVSLIKAMWASKNFTKQQIHPYFTRPDRPINQARISQIADGKIYASAPKATDKQLQAFLSGPRDFQTAKRRFLQEDPWHADNLAQLLRLKSDSTSILDLGETDIIECKLSFSWNNRGEYARTFAGFSNNRGGYLLFGINNDTREVIGIPKGKLDDLDSAKISAFLNEKLSPSVRWDKRELNFVDKAVGAIYVWPAVHKPVICAHDHQNDLKEGDVYFRYVGQTTRIRYAELAMALAERDRALEQRWMEVFGKVAKAGANNIAILDTLSGELSGANASYLIDQSVLPSLTFLREGEFEEKKGATALKLVGTAQAIALPESTVTKTVIERADITDFEILDTFLGQKKVVNPAAYIRHLCHTESKWLPVHYFIRQAGMSVPDVVKLLQDEPTHAPNRKANQIERIKQGTGPKPPYAGALASAREPLLAKLVVDLSTWQKAETFLRAVRTLNGNEIDLGYLLPMMKNCFDQFYGKVKRVSVEIRYAASHVDAECFRAG